MSAADVTICIPTWKSAEFIGRTLECARNQTHAAVRILVSVDLCDDGTAAICEAAAREDARIEVIVQPERLGWSRNCNALLDRVQTDFYFLYFHDDLIEPTYVETLRAALLARPDAASAHCDVQKFGLRTEYAPGVAIEGAPARRLTQYLLGPRGESLRCLARRTVLERGARFPAIFGDKQHTANLYLLAILAEGPMLHAPQPLYRRWFRDGMMTRGWMDAPVEEEIRAWREYLEAGSALIDALPIAPAERALAGFALRLRLALELRRREVRRRTATPLALDQLSPLLPGPDLPAEAERLLDSEARGWVSRARSEIALAGAHAARLREDWDAMAAGARAAAAADDSHAAAHLMLGLAFEKQGRFAAAADAAESALRQDATLEPAAALRRRCAANVRRAGAGRA